METYLKEEWKPLTLEGCEEIYSVSNYSRIYNHVLGKFIAQVITGKPQYYYVNLKMSCGKRILRRVHNIMARAFIPNPEGHKQVDHIDRNKFNNSLDNLRWVSRSQNMNNRDKTIMFKGLPIKVFIQENYPLDEGAYNYLRTCFVDQGKSEDESIQRYERYLSQGVLGTKIISCNDRNVFLLDFLEEQGLTLEDYNRRRLAGISNEGIMKGYKYSLVMKEYLYSVEVTATNGVILWFDSGVTLAKDLGISPTSVRTRKENGCTSYKDYLDYIPSTDHIDTYTLDGNIGTIRELSEIYGLRYETVTNRLSAKGWSLERSLKTKRLKIRDYHVNGIKMTKKMVWEKFVPEVLPKNLNGFHSKRKIPLDRFLEKYYGVDLTEYVIEPCM